MGVRKEGETGKPHGDRQKPGGVEGESKGIHLEKGGKGVDNNSLTKGVHLPAAILNQSPLKGGGERKKGIKEKQRRGEGTGQQGSGRTPPGRRGA